MFVYDTFCSDDARRRDAWLLEEGEWAHQSLSSNGERLAEVRSSAPVNPLNRGRRNRRQRRRVAALRREEAAADGTGYGGGIILSRSVSIATHSCPSSRMAILSFCGRYSRRYGC